MTSSRKRKESKPRVVDCVICNKKFETTHSQGKYCSKECRQIGHRKTWNKYGSKNRELRNEWGRSYYRIIKEKRTIQIKEYSNTLKGKEVTRKSNLKSRQKYPEKYKARGETNKALKRGIVVRKPCEVCGKLKSEAHHLDYSNPLDIIWLCNFHHREIHIKEGRVVS